MPWNLWWQSRAGLRAISSCLQWDDRGVTSATWAHVLFVGQISFGHRLLWKSHSRHGSYHAVCADEQRTVPLLNSKDEERGGVAECLQGSQRSWCPEKQICSERMYCCVWDLNHAIQDNEDQWWFTDSSTQLKDKRSSDRWLFHGSPPIGFVNR